MATKRKVAAWTACAVVALGLAGGPARGQDIVIGQFGDPFDEFVDCPFGWTCTPGFPSASFLVNFPDANDPSMGGGLQLTPPGLGDLAVSAFANTPYDIQTNRMRATFDLFIAGESDGMTFAIIDATTNGSDYVGGAGGSLGWGGAVQGMAIEFDIHDDSENADPDDNHVGVNLNGSLVSEASSSSAAGPGIELCTIGFELGSATIYNVEVEFDNGHLEVHMTGGTLPGRVKMLDVNLPPFPSDQALFGFTAGTGGGSAQHVVDNLQISLTPGVSAPPSTTLQTLAMPFAVNCGSGARVTGDGVDFEPDQRYREGATGYGWVGSFGEDLPDGSGNNSCLFPDLLSLKVPADPPGLEDMYNSVRLGPANANFGYRFLVEDGTYRVTLYFAEPSGFYGALDIEGELLLLPLCYGADLSFTDAPGSTGLRRMDVVLEGVKVVENFSLIDLPTPEFPHLAGELDGIVVRTAQRPGYATLDPISVVDGVLDIDLLLHDNGVVEDLAGPAISGIKIERVGPAEGDPRPLVLAAEDALVIQDGRMLPDGSLYLGTRDTTIQEKRPDANNGKAEHLEVGRTGNDPAELGDPEDDRSIVLRFNGIANIVDSTMAGRPLISATLRLDYFSSRPTDDDDIGYQVNGDDYLEAGHCPALTVQRADLIPQCDGLGLPPSIPFPGLASDAFCGGTPKVFSVHEMLTPWSEGTGSDETDGQIEPPGGTGATWNHAMGAGSAEWAGASRAQDFAADPFGTMVLTDPTQMNLGAAKKAGAGFTSVVPTIFDAGVGLISLPSYRTVEIDVTELARAWMTSDENPGILIRDDPNSPIVDPEAEVLVTVNELKGTRTFKSREWPSIVDRPSLTLVFGDVIPQGPPPELVQIAEGVGRINGDTGLADTFISPKGEGVAFDRIAVELSEEAEIVGAAEVVWTGDEATKPEVAEFVSAGGGRHTLVFDGPLEAGHWAKVTLTVRAMATQAEGTITLWVAHFPNDLNQDGIINIRDASEFGARFRDAMPVLLLIDLNGDGALDIRDATEFGQQWFGGWQNQRLPAKPA